MMIVAQRTRVNFARGAAADVVYLLVVGVSEIRSVRRKFGCDKKKGKVVGWCVIGGGKTVAKYGIMYKYKG